MKPTYVLALFCVAAASAAGGDDESGIARNSHAVRQAVEEWIKLDAGKRPAFAGQAFAATALTRADADAIRDLLWADRKRTIRSERAGEWRERTVRIGTSEMRFDVRTFGTKPRNGRSLYLSLHGGGSTPARINDRQWENQKRLYAPKEGLYIAPRAPIDSWDMWHKPPVGKLLERIIADAIAIEDADPDHVYLTGYSAGGDGLYRLAPRLADRWAAAAMMAGHPGDASPLSLRNLPFAIHVGENDSAFERNKRAAEWGRKLDELRRADPRGYEHDVELHSGKGHWMDREDARAIGWMARHKRQPFPIKIVWKPDEHSRPQFYWLAAPDSAKLNGSQATATIDGQRIVIRAEKLPSMRVRLCDEMLDLDKPVTIEFNGRTAFSGLARRSAKVIDETLRERDDPRFAFSAELEVR